MSRLSVVVTSISRPNPVLNEIARGCLQLGFDFIVIGDTRTPADFALSGCDYYDVVKQLNSGFHLSRLLPTGHYSRKNLGYLLSMQSRAQRIVETDDDNFPLASFWELRSPDVSAPTLEKQGWMNVYSFFTSSHVWPRGLPLDTLRDSNPPLKSLAVSSVHCPIQQGLADENPDVDAIYRLVGVLPVYFDHGLSVALGPGTWCPFNSQNTLWFPEVYPLLYLPSHCSFRMTDIWRSFIAQRLMWENNWSVLFYSPTVSQTRNDHNLMKDFADEVPGYLNNRRIGEILDGVSLRGQPEYIGGDLCRCYEALVRERIFPIEELALLKAWLQDVEHLGFCSASS